MTNAENIYKAFGIRKAIISLQKVQKRPAAEVPRDRRGRPYSDPSVTGKRLASDAPKTSESQVGVRGARQKFTPDEVPTVGVRGGQQRFTPKQKMAMSKALIPLQKFLDNDCGCEEDTLMQHSKGNPGKDKKGRAAYKDVQDKAERRQGGAYANKERDSEHRIEYPVGDTSEGGHLGGWGTGKENYEAEMKYLRRQGRGGTEGDYPEQRRATPPSKSMRRGALADAKRTAKRKQDEANELPW